MKKRTKIRQFDSGATRDADAGKLDFEGFLSPLVIARFGEYMHKHRVQSDGSLRDSDNWQLGIPLTAYMKSGWRHFYDWWLEHRGCASYSWHAAHSGPEDLEDLEEAVCALIFNAQGYLHEVLKTRGYRPKRAE